MTTTDPILKQLVADATANETSIPMTLYLPSGKPLYGHLTSHEDFCAWATTVLGRESAYTGTIAPAADPEYVHLSVEPLSFDGSDVAPDVVRVRLADVVAWTVG